MMIYLWISINRISLFVDIKWNGGNLVLDLNNRAYRFVSRSGGFPFSQVMRPTHQCEFFRAFGTFADGLILFRGTYFQEGGIFLTNLHRTTFSGQETVCA